MLGSDKIGRRLLVLIAMGFCMGALLVVGILGLVPRTQALMNFLIFVACVWSFFNSIGESQILQRTPFWYRDANLIFAFQWEASAVPFRVRSAHRGFELEPPVLLRGWR